MKLDQVKDLLKLEKGISGQVIECFKERFVCRPDAFVEQYEHDGKISYRKIERSLSSRDIENHLLGLNTYGGYTATPYSESLFCGFDVDIPKDMEINEVTLRGATKTVLDLLISCIELGLTRAQVTIEFSGRRGFHVWLFFRNPIPSWQALSFAKVIADRSKVKCEFFPKQYLIGKDGYGNAIKFPLGIHRATNNRCLFVDEEFKPYKDQLEYLLSIETIPVNIVQDILLKHNIPLEPKIDELSHLETSDDIEFDLSEKGGSLEKLFSKCKAFLGIRDRAGKNKHLVHAERVALANILPLFGNMGELELHKIIKQCADYLAERTQDEINYRKERKYKPITCRWMKDKGLCDYDCGLEPKTGQEPSPLQLCFVKENSYKPFQLEEEGKDRLILKTDTGLTFNLSNFGSNKNSVWTRIEFIGKEGVIYCDSPTISSAKSRTQFINKCLELKGTEIVERLDLERYLIALEGIVRRKISEIRKNNMKDKEPPKMTEAEKEEALGFLTNKNILDSIVEDITAMGYMGEDTNKLMVYLISTSRKLNKPLACVIKAVSSAGKNALVSAVLVLIPEEDKKVISRMTQNALYYMAKNGLSHKVLHIAERVGVEEADYAIRSLISERKLTVCVPIKNPNTGAIESQEYEVEGPVSYIETTTQTNINDENDTRMFTLTIDETEEQTKRIQDAQRKQHTLAGLIQDGNRKRIIRKHWNAQRLLKEVEIVIPYAEKLEFPSDRVRTRRDNEKLLFLIKTICFLRQYQKEVKTEGGINYIEADLTDYEYAYNLSSAILWQTLDEVSKRSRDLLVIIEKMVHEWLADPQIEEPELLNDKVGSNVLTNLVFKRSDVRRYAKGWSDAAIHASMRELGNYELLRVTQGGQGRTYKYTLIDRDKYTNQESKKLLTPEELKARLNESTS